MKKLLLTVLSIAAVMAGNAQTLNDSLKVHLRFNGNADDTSGNGNHGTIVGATLTNAWMCNFDGNGDYITLPSTDIFNPEYTYSLWFRSTSVLQNNTKMVLLSVGGADCNQSITLTQDYMGSNGLSAVGHYQAGSTYTANSSAIPQQSVWVHVVGVKTSDSIFIYVDGNLIQGAPAQAPCYSGADPRGVIGAGVDLNNNFEGVIADVRIYNRPLADWEVYNLYNLNILSNDVAAEVPHQLFPNPVNNDQLTLQTPAAVQEVRVFDMTGKEMSLVYDGQSGLISLDASIITGTYVLRVNTDQGVITRRISVQR